MMFFANQKDMIRKIRNASNRQQIKLQPNIKQLQLLEKYTINKFLTSALQSQYYVTFYRKNTIIQKVIADQIKSSKLNFIKSYRAKQKSALSALRIHFLKLLIKQIRSQIQIVYQTKSISNSYSKIDYYKQSKVIQIKSKQLDQVSYSNQPFLLTLQQRQIIQKRCSLNLNSTLKQLYRFYQQTFDSKQLLHATKPKPNINTFIMTALELKHSIHGISQLNFNNIKAQFKFYEKLQKSLDQNFDRFSNLFQQKNQQKNYSSFVCEIEIWLLDQEKKFVFQREQRSDFLFIISQFDFEGKRYLNKKYLMNYIFGTKRHLVLKAKQKAEKIKEIQERQCQLETYVFYFNEDNRSLDDNALFLNSQALDIYRLYREQNLMKIVRENITKEIIEKIQMHEDYEQIISERDMATEKNMWLQKKRMISDRGLQELENKMKKLIKNIKGLSGEVIVNQIEDLKFFLNKIRND